MLKGLDPILGPDLLHLLRAMGHGDDLVLADRNFPAQSVASETSSGRLIRLDGVDIVSAAKAILSVYPLDTFVEQPVQRMEVVGKPDDVLSVHADVQNVINAAEGRDRPMGSIERFSFYAQAKKAFAVVSTSEDRPYGCFILKKGVV